MATGTAQPNTLLPPAPPVPGESQERDRVIRRQLARTSTQVRLVDLACSLAVWIIGVLLLFIGTALFDHFVGLGTVGRFVALAALVGCSLWYLLMHVGPLLVRTINPAYAARTIEEATPTLKNSLINFLLLRQDRSGLKEIVFQAVEQQAAADIATVPVEATVDRTRLIHAGYALCAVMTVVAVYKILSPKDPFQTVARVLAPWAEIARPSRVQISDVRPGSAEVYHGQRVAVSATVRGAREDDKVKVLYSTADGQTIDQPIEMKLSAGDRFECELPPERSGSAAATGLLQNAVYRIVAGDAETFPFRLTVVSAPTIIVDRLENQYPAYTRKPADSFLQQGDIKALEGTKVTIHAIANQPIKSAWIEFDPTTADAAAETVPLIADGDRAQGTILLQLRPGDRQTPWHATYQVRFYNERGQRSQQPILHKIEVIRDLPPEVQILAPERMRVEVPEDGEQTIEVRAVDPDFALAGLRIEGAAGGKPPVSINLLDESTGQPPQVTVRCALRPREHNLSAGDEFRYGAVAEDNRANPLNGQAEPNVTRTKEYTLVITAPRSNERGQPGSGAAEKTQPNPDKAKAEQQPDKSSQKGQQGKTEQQQPDQKSQQPMNDGGKGNQEQAGKQNESQKNQQKNGEQGGQQQNEAKADESNKQEGNPQQSGNQQSGEQNQQQQQSGKEQGGQQKGGQQHGAQSDGSQQSNQQGSEPKNQSGGKSGSGSQQTGQSSTGGEAGKAAGQGGRSGQETGSEQQSSGQADDRQAGERPEGADSAAGGRGENSGKAQHDGQAFERIWKDLQKRDQEQSQNNQSQKGGENQQGQPNQANGGQGPGESTPNDKNQSQPMPGSKEPADKGQKSGSEKGGQPQSGGASSAQNQNVPNAGRPEGNDQQLNQKGGGEKPEGKAGDANQRLPDDKEGQNPSEQQNGGNKGGAPRGPSQTDKGEKPSGSKGENRDTGAGNTGQEGAGKASPDKTGAGEGTSQNRDRDKQMPPDGNKAEQGDTSPASSSKKQSDSKGGESGAESGGGKKGAGQSAGQEGNDSAGSKSAGDQGAGKANETGAGETGSKAGQQQKAEGKTGKSGDEKGDGSAARPGNDSQDPGTKGGKSNGGDASKSSKQAGSREPASGGEAGSQPVGGTDDGSQRSPSKSTSTEEQEADAANLEYARKATEMVLKKLKEEEHNPDPELLDKLGWTRDELSEFLRRWDALQKSATESPSGKHELDEALKTLGLRDPATRKRAGGKTSDNQRDLRDTGNRSAPPPRYRDLFDAFRKGAARSAP